MAFTPRTTRPGSGNKYYITKSKGGYSNAIKGQCGSTGKPDPQNDVLANCVGYAYGRFNEIGGYKSCKYLSPTNAENFPEHATGCKTGSTPKLGAVIVWKKGGSLSGSDGAGHVAVVEKINSDGSILISQSGWNSSVFWTETIKKGDGNWRCSWMGSAYKFRCFIYNPAVSDKDQVISVASLQKGSTGSSVKTLQTNLNKLGYKLTVDGEFGAKTDAAVRDFQKKNGLTVDGIVGSKTQEMIKNKIAKLSTTTTTTKPKAKAVVKKGSKNATVKTLQKDLNKLGYKLTVDGDFGSKTEAAVKDFQKKHKLTVDGIVGAKTWAAIDKLV